MKHSGILIPEYNTYTNNESVSVLYNKIGQLNYSSLYKYTYSTIIHVCNTITKHHI